ncbi:MAG: DASS family sodium-coupled anion symporter [Verrucomicrobiota bacterium]
MIDLKRDGRKLKNSLIVVLSTLLFIAILKAAPLAAIPEGADWSQIRTGLAILVLAAILWFTEAIPLSVTALLVPLLASLTGVMDVKSSFSAFAHPLIFLLFGGFALAAALSRHGLDRWIAYGALMIGRRYFYPTAFALFSMTAFMSMWISNTATTAIMVPIALGMIMSLKKAGDEDSANRVTPFLILGVAYSASLGGIGLLIGTAPNAIAAAQLGLDFIGWMKVGLPTVAILFPLLCGLLVFIFKPGSVPQLIGNDERQSLSRSGVATLFVLGLTLLCWFFGRDLASFFGIESSFAALVAISAIVVLSVSRLLEWKDIDEAVDWGVVVLFGGGITLSNVMSETGASLYLANGIVAVAGQWALIAFLGLLILFVIFLTEVSSNTATTAILVPIFAAVAPQLGIAQAQLVIPIAIASSCAFMLPIATPPNAIAYATGEITQVQMVRAGWILNLVFAITMTLVSLIIYR